MTSPLLPELLTEGDSVEDALENVRDALAAVLELYQDLGRPLPDGLAIADPEAPVWQERILVAAPMRYHEVGRKLSSLGCREIPRTGSGSHRKWFNPTTRESTVVPDWGGRDLKQGTIRRGEKHLDCRGTSSARRDRSRRRGESLRPSPAPRHKD